MESDYGIDIDEWVPLDKDNLHQLITNNHVLSALEITADNDDLDINREQEGKSISENTHLKGLGIYQKQKHTQGQLED